MDDKSSRPCFLIYKSFYKPIKNLSYEDKGKLDFQKHLYAAYIELTPSK